MKNEKCAFIDDKGIYDFDFGEAGVHSCSSFIVFKTQLLSKESMMTNYEKIISFLQQCGNGFCDDCLAKITGVYPRQQVNQICNRHDEQILKQHDKTCSLCGKIKITRHFQKIL